MTKLLWHSNAPWTPTGYGQQTGLFAPHLAKHYDLAISSFYGLEGSPLHWQDIPVLPGVGGMFGDEHLVQHAKHFFGGDPRDGLVATLMDVWVLDTDWMSRMNVASWVPVDHEPAPPKVLEFFMKTGAVPIAMSQFGMQMLGRLDPLYVPHGVDTSVYKPHDKQAIRRHAGFPEDAFLVGIVAANKGRPSRKCFSQALQAFRKLLDKHENAYLYLHTTLSPQIGGGEDLTGLMETLGVPDNRVRVVNQYAALFNPHPDHDMATLYSAFDVLLNPAMGEGFGIPVLEAQACGTPVIVTDFSAMTELCGAGWKVRYDQKYWSGLSSWQAIPDVHDIADALQQCYCLSPEQRASMSRQARDFAMGYDINRVLEENMLPALRAAEQRFASQAPFSISPRLKAAA